MRVWLNEEYGYRLWVWTPGMTPEEFEAFWTSMPTVDPHFMDPSQTLPGILMRIRFHGERGTWVTPDGQSVDRSTFGWAGHVHLDDDSSIQTPDGRVLYHAGYSGRRA